LLLYILIHSRDHADSENVCGVAVDLRELSSSRVKFIGNKPIHTGTFNLIISTEEEADTEEYFVPKFYEVF